MRLINNETLSKHLKGCLSLFKKKSETAPSANGEDIDFEHTNETLTELSNGKEEK